MERKCKYCKKRFIAGTTGYRDFDKITCYQNYRYNNIPKVMASIKKQTVISRRKRYKKDKAFRKECKGYTDSWRARNPERTREIARLSARRQYARKTGKIIKGMKICKFCQKEITTFLVTELTQRRTVCHYKEGVLNIGNNVIIKNVKIFKCPHCSHKLFDNQRLALGWLNKK